MAKRAFSLFDWFSKILLKRDGIVRSAKKNMTKIDKKIMGYKVSATGTEEPPTTKTEMSEAVERPHSLLGITYKIKPPNLDHAVYITINDIVLDEGLETESKHPYEIFINSKNMEQFQWITAMTRVVSAVFRKGGDVWFLVDELKAVVDPNGGYYKRGGVFMPSIVSEIGFVLSEHLERK